MPRHPSVLARTFRLDSSIQPTRRVEAAVVDALLNGHLHDGDPLPSSRAFAQAFDLPRTAVVAAYDGLSAAGLLAARPGSGTWVASGAGQLAASGVLPAVTPSPGHELPPAPAEMPRATDLTPGLPALELLDAARWARAWRRAADPTIADPSGVELRVAVAAHLRRYRGIAAEPDDITVEPSLNALLSRIGLAHPGATVAVEDPGYPSARQALAAVGCRIRPVPVDDHGIRVDLLRPTDGLVYVTPAHQYPTGVLLSTRRRMDLLAWAARNRALVIEDDYDGEFRYDRPPLPPLVTMRGGRDHVAHVGTASKILTPELRVAWGLLPARLLPARTERVDVCGIAGRVFAHYVHTGELDRHVARAMRTYRARRAELTRALTGVPVRLHGLDAGLHAQIELPTTVDEAAVVSSLAQQGFIVVPLSYYAARPAHPSLVVGYSRLPETQAAAFAQALRTALAESAS